MPAPTPEQSTAVDAFRRGYHLVLQVGAVHEATEERRLSGENSDQRIQEFQQVT